MKLFLSFVMLLTTMTGSTYAIQRPEGIQGVPEKVSKRTQGRTECLAQGILSKKPKISCSPAPLSQGKPTALCLQTKLAKAYEQGRVQNSPEAPKKPMRSVQTKVHQEKPTNPRPLSPVKRESRISAQQLQPRNRALLRFSTPLLKGSEVPDKVEALAQAIAKAEGFFVKSALPNRLHNPGDIKALRGYKFPGQVGIHKQYVVFKNDKAGWAALQHQIDKILAGESRYNVNLTLKQLGKRYAESSIWPRVVAKYLNVSPSTALWEILGVPPALESKWFTS